MKGLEVIMENYMLQAEKWLGSDKVSEDFKEEIRALDEVSLKTRFSDYMSFGTAGLRAEMGVGTAFMNVYTVAHATMGLASLISEMGDNAKKRGAVIAYDSRNNSEAFARRAAEVLSAEGIKVYLFSELRPTPVLSFAVRELGCVVGINITASHNPKKYNGYKAYFEDGAQLSPENAEVVSKSMAKLDIFEDVPMPCEAKEEFIVMLGRDFDEKYIENVLAQSVNADAIKDVADEFEIIYTPLHGAGTRLVPEVLKRAGLKKLYTVESQREPDGEFPTVTFPNPEFPEAFDEGIKVSKTKNCALIIATDPDADRVGVMAKDRSGNFKCITGNQMGALLMDYIISAYERLGKMPPSPYAVKTIVTSEMAAEICKSHGVKTYNVLTGFKFIGEVIKKHEESGDGTFLLGFEESYGYLKGTYARDKDAVVASLLIAEMAAYYGKMGMTLSDALDALFEKYGYFKESVTNLVMDTPDWKVEMEKVMRGLRTEHLEYIGDEKIVEFRDYLSCETVNYVSGEKGVTGLPSSDVLYYVTESGNVTVVRPSGTEPKIKIYVLSKGESEAAAASSAEKCLEGIKSAVGL